MIWNLNQINFKSYGTILPEKEQPFTQINCSSVSLMPEKTFVYRCDEDTWLYSEYGQTILSVSTDAQTFRDFYLDKQVWVRKGVWFALTALHTNASAKIGGSSIPQPLQVRQAGSFEIRPQLRVDCIYTFFYHEKEQGFIFPGEAHPMMELTYVDQGTMHSVADGQDLLLEQGDMVLYGPGQWHMQYSDMGIAPRYVTISFDVSGMDVSGLTNRKFRSPQKAIVLLQQMLHEQEKMDAAANDMIISLLTTMLITLLRTAQQPSDRIQPPHCVNNENEIIRRAQQYISQHVREKMSVTQVAKNTDVSTSYLTALFHKHLQISPGEYIRRIKLQESKQMIREGNRNFTEIAAALQYSTIHHFSRQFKEKFGITPSEYAKSVK